MAKKLTAPKPIITVSTSQLVRPCLVQIFFEKIDTLALSLGSKDSSRKL